MTFYSFLAVTDLNIQQLVPYTSCNISQEVCGVNWKAHIFSDHGILPLHMFQNLRIKRFYGNSANAVKTQIWIAISTFLIVAIMRKELKINASLYTILQILSVNIFERIPLLQIVGNCSYENEILSNTKQLSLFD